MLGGHIRYTYAEKQARDQHQRNHGERIVELSTRMQSVEQSHGTCSKQMSENIIRIYERIEKTEQALMVKIDRLVEIQNRTAIALAELNGHMEAMADSKTSKGKRHESQ